jgi:hypothetical protein
MLKQPDPICEECARLNKEPNPDNDLINNLSPSTRYLYFVIDVKNENTMLEGIQYVEMAPGLDKDIRTKAADPRTQEWIDISHPVSGRNIVINRTGKGKTDTKYNVVKLEERTQAQAEVIKAYMEAAPSFDDILLFHDYNTLKEEFTGSISAVAAVVADKKENVTNSATANPSGSAAIVQPNPVVQSVSVTPETAVQLAAKVETAAAQPLSLAERIKAKLAQQKG